MVPSSPLIAIVGPTASGKSSLGIDIASKYRGEIICADSRTIYKGMNIGTAKPSMTEQKGIPHHCLDILLPDQAYSAAQFKNDAEQLIQDINKRNRLPIIVGGTGLYVYSVMYGYQFPAGADNKLRKQLEAYETENLAKMLKKLDEPAYQQIDIKNPRRLIRAIETVGKPKIKSHQLGGGSMIIGLAPKTDILEKRIAARTKDMIDQGLVAEVQNLKDVYGVETEALQAIGYKEIVDYVAGEISLDKAIELINLHSRQLAKRQMTWFQRNKDIRWVEVEQQAERLVDTFLSKFATI